MWIYRSYMSDEKGSHSVLVEDLRGQNLEGPDERQFLFDFMESASYRELEAVPVEIPLFLGYTLNNAEILGNGFYRDKCKNCFIIDDNGVKTCVRPETVSMFTGETDCSGTPIYDNDIVRTDEGNWVGRLSGPLQRSIVMYSKTGFSVDTNWTSSKVLGNMFVPNENTELFIKNNSEEKSNEEI